ncbi:NAD-dependent epimerase/dehydratase family protein [Halosimplex salinum]|uniref:NAD-dependent epimerase/dehydratase family protein n=1 Tax=Halosimplex salinum TaxID=1710538 RepID=UPI000F468882|nr:NAD(P)-dependent oxidoreductase [Halosimplex salinum]
MADILVTGGTGFIGANLVNELRERDHNVWTLDIDFSPDERHYRVDIGEYRQLRDVFDEHDFDYVYNAAAEYGRWNGEDHYENLWQTNAVGTKNILRIQADEGFRLIDFSSAEVYGDHSGTMTEELTEEQSFRLMNDYAMSKRVNEMQVRNAMEKFGTESVMVRPVNCYGPQEHYSEYRGVVPIFIWHALNDKPYTVYEGHKRIFDYVGDTARTLANIVDNFHPGEVYNLGGNPDWEISIGELSDLILDYLDKDDGIVTYEEKEEMTTDVKRIDSTKARDHLNHDPQVPPEEGIPETIEWFKSEYDL